MMRASRASRPDGGGGGVVAPVGRVRIMACAVALVAVGACTASSGSSGSSAASSDTGYRKVGYFVQWGVYDRHYFAKDVDTSGAASELTTINYAFGNVD